MALWETKAVREARERERERERAEEIAEEDEREREWLERREGETPLEHAIRLARRNAADVHLLAQRAGAHYLAAGIAETNVLLLAVLDKLDELIENTR